MLAKTGLPTEGAWMQIIEIGGPAVAIIFALALASILVFKYGVNPGLTAFAKITANQRESTIESRVAAEASRDAAEASRESASQCIQSVERLDETHRRMAAGGTP